MWTTVILLALAVSIEPTRIGLIAVLLTKAHPVRHLLTFLLTGLTVSMSVGLLVLLVFRRGFPGQSKIDPAWVQIGIGVVALLLAALLASNIPLGRLGKGSSSEAARETAQAAEEMAAAVEPSAAGDPKRLATRVRNFVKGESRWLSGSIGAALAMPSFDYMALLALIIASGAPALEQVAALLTFLLLASAAAVIPLFSFLVAPDKTRETVQRFNAWILSRTRRDAAIFVGILGVLLVGIGWIHL